MPMPNWVRIARMKAQEENNRAARQALDDPDHGRDGRDPAPVWPPRAARRWQQAKVDELDLIKIPGTGIERPTKGWINRFSVTENWAQTSTPLLLTTTRPLETVSEQPALTDRPLDQSPSERAMAPINA